MTKKITKRIVAYSVSKDGETKERPTPPVDGEGMEECPDCGEKAVKREGGCAQCTECSWSACDIG